MPFIFRAKQSNLQGLARGLAIGAQTYADTRVKLHAMQQKKLEAAGRVDAGLLGLAGVANSYGMDADDPRFIEYHSQISGQTDARGKAMIPALLASAEAEWGPQFLAQNQQDGASSVSALSEAYPALSGQFQSILAEADLGNKKGVRAFRNLLAVHTNEEDVRINAAKYLESDDATKLRNELLSKIDPSVVVDLDEAGDNWQSLVAGLMGQGKMTGEQRWIYSDIKRLMEIQEDLRQAGRWVVGSAKQSSSSLRNEAQGILEGKMPRNEYHEAKEKAYEKGRADAAAEASDGSENMPEAPAADPTGLKVMTDEEARSTFDDMLRDLDNGINDMGDLSVVADRFQSGMRTAHLNWDDKAGGIAYRRIAEELGVPSGAPAHQPWSVRNIQDMPDGPFKSAITAELGKHAEQASSGLLSSLQSDGYYLAPTDLQFIARAGNEGKLNRTMASRGGTLKRTPDEDDPRSQYAIKEHKSHTQMDPGIEEVTDARDVYAPVKTEAELGTMTDPKASGGAFQRTKTSLGSLRSFSGAATRRAQRATSSSVTFPELTGVDKAFEPALDHMDRIWAKHGDKKIEPYKTMRSVEALVERKLTAIGSGRARDEFSGKLLRISGLANLAERAEPQEQARLFEEYYRLVDEILAYEKPQTVND